MKRLSLILLLALASPAWAGPYEDAKAAGAKGDHATELRIVRPLAENGVAWAQHYLGALYFAGEGVVKDHAEATKWLRLAALRGDAEAQNFMGNIYHDGQGVAQDYAESSKWVKLAAEQGIAQAQFHLGYLYENGEGVVQDYTESVNWYRLSAAQGYAKAQNSLGVMYHSARGVPQDYAHAHMWFNLAAASGNEDAIKNRALAAGQMSPSQIGEAQKLARECLARQFKGCDRLAPEIVPAIADDTQNSAISMLWVIYGLGVLLWIPIQYLLMRKKFGEISFVDRAMWAKRELNGEHISRWKKVVYVYLVPSLTVVSLALIFPLAMFFAVRERISAQR